MTIKLQQGLLSKRFQLIFILSVLLSWLHFVECILTKYYEVGPVFMDYFHSVKETAYFAFHLPFYLFLVAVLLLLKGGKWVFIPLAYYGFSLFLEYHHFIRSIIQMGYYPGMTTSFFFPILGIFYWAELVNIWRKFSKV